nr:hypothetical protein [Fusobacterium nucleatum]
MSSVFTVTYTIFLLLILEVFNALLALKPNLKEVTEAISPFDFVFRFSTVENLYNVKTYSYHNTEDVNSDMYIHYTVLKIMNICILEIKFSRVANKDVIVPATPLPVEFRPKSTEYLSAVAATGGIKMDYHWLRLEPNGNFYTHNNAGITVRNLQTTIAYITAN